MVPDTFSSQLVIDEASVGDPTAAAERLKLLDGLATVPIDEDVRTLAREIVSKSLMPQKAAADALHVAADAVAGIQYLLPWIKRCQVPFWLLGSFSGLPRDLSVDFVCLFWSSRSLTRKAPSLSSESYPVNQNGTRHLFFRHLFFRMEKLSDMWREDDSAKTTKEAKLA